MGAFAMNSDTEKDENSSTQKLRYSLYQVFSAIKNPSQNFRLVAVVQIEEGMNSESCQGAIQFNALPLGMRFIFSGSLNLGTLGSRQSMDGRSSEMLPSLERG